MSEATVPLMRDPIPSVNVTVHEPFEVLYQREFRPMVRLATALVDAPVCWARNVPDVGAESKDHCNAC